MAETLARPIYTRDNPRPVPKPLRIARAAYILGVIALFAVLFVAVRLHPGLRLQHWDFFGYWQVALAAVLLAGLWTSLIGLRYRDGWFWLLVWFAVFLGSGLLLPAGFS